VAHKILVPCVTKIASVAGEIADPGRNLPRAILVSMGVMMVVISVVAVLALTSMANAGVLASSRFPLVMSRDSLLPRRLTRIDPRFKTPRAAILLTGGLLVALIAFVPVVELAKLASAFQILVFSIVNVAVIVFRESGVDFYQPSFIAPGFPFVQIVGVLGGFGLLTQMGALPILGAVGIVVGGLVWYLAYGRSRTDRVGAVTVLLQRRRGPSDEAEPARIEADRE